MKALIITVPGLRVDCLGCYGNDWIDTPHLDEVAAESVVFDQHYADQPDTEGAFRAWLTGSRSSSLTARPDLLHILADAGIESRLIADSRAWPPGWFADRFRKSQRVEALEAILETARKAVASLNRRPNALIWVDVPSLLPPWDIPAEYLDPYFTEEEEESEQVLPWTDPIPAVVPANDETTLLRLQRTYAGAVSYLDAYLGGLFEAMRKKEWMQDWLVIVTAPYGLPLGDHGIAGLHRPWLHEERWHLPLLLRLPSSAQEGLRIGGLTQSVDLTATLLDSFGLPIPTMPGQSLLPLCRSEQECSRSEVYAALRIEDAEEWALRTSEWSFLLPIRVPSGDPQRGPQLYVKPDDRHEVNNVVQHHLELAEELEKKMRDGAASV